MTRSDGEENQYKIQAWLLAPLLDKEGLGVVENAVRSAF